MKNSKVLRLMTEIVTIVFVTMVLFLYLRGLDSAMRRDIIIALNEIGKHDIKAAGTFLKAFQITSCSFSAKRSVNFRPIS